MEHPVSGSATGDSSVGPALPSMNDAETNICVPSDSPTGGISGSKHISMFFKVF